MSLINKITKDFSPENHHRLFKGQKEFGATRWYFCKEGADTTISLKDNDFLYYLEYDPSDETVTIGTIHESHSIFELEAGCGAKVIQILKSLDAEREAAWKAEQIIKKQAFVKSILNC